MNFTVAKKRKLNKKETEVVKALERVIKYLTKEYSIHPCKEILLTCPNCQYAIILGGLYSLKGDIEY
jgi:hypothetical protein